MLNARTSVGVILLVVGLILAILTGAAYLQPSRAIAEIRDAKENLVGRATFIQQMDGVDIIVNVAGLSPGMHGIHVHAQGKCDPPDFATAGGHFNPEGKHHGLDNPEGPHAGDMPNLNVNPDGTGTLEYLNPRISLVPGAKNSLLKVNGTSIMIHDKADDQKTDPSGNSGTRIACGVILADPTFAGVPLWMLAASAIILIVIGTALIMTGRIRKTAPPTY
jgi:Cu-Zn family superoxide dismutase